MANDKLTPVTAVREAVRRFLDVMTGAEDYSKLHEYTAPLNTFGFAAVTPELVKTLEDPSVRRRVAAAGTLFNWRDAGVLVSDAQLAMASQVLVTGLKSRDGDFKSQSAKIAGSLGIATDEMIPVLKRLLKSDSSEVRVSAAAALARSELSPLIAGELGKALRTDDVFLIQMAARGYGRLRMAERQSVDRLIQKLGDVEPVAQIVIVNALGQIGAAATRCVPELIRFLKTKATDTTVRGTIARNLGIVARARQEVEEALIWALRDRSWQVVQGAIFGLAEEKNEWPVKGVEILVGLLKSEDDDLRMTAARAFADNIPPAQCAAPVLVELLLNESNGTICQLARKAVLKTGVQAVPSLIEWMQRNHDRYGPLIYYTLSEIGEAAIPEILTLFRTTDDMGLREAAALTFYALGPKAVAAVPELLELAKNGDADLRIYIVTALAAVGPKGAAAMEFLVAALLYGEENTVVWAAEGLKSIGEAVIPILEEGLDVVDEPSRARIEPVLRQLKEADGRGKVDPLAWIKDDAAVELFVLCGRILRGPEAKSFKIISDELKDVRLHFAASTKKSLIVKKINRLETLLTPPGTDSIRLIDRKSTVKGKLTPFGSDFLLKAELSLSIRIEISEQSRS